VDIGGGLLKYSRVDVIDVGIGEGFCGAVLGEVWLALTGLTVGFIRRID
jgi:hypothetical protein